MKSDSALQDPWEAAYSRFETPEEEVRKFVARLKEMGALAWSRDGAIVELFCGRGNGLHALERLGFSRVEGIDLSPRLLALYTGTAKCTVGDCRRLPFDDQSRDVVIVQGGLHHLPHLPEDLEQTFSETRRVLKKDGRVMFVEPWNTPFLRFVHVVCESPLARKYSVKLDALATMIEHERPTYEQWLTHPQLVLSLAEKYFTPLRQSFAWGKWRFLGVPRA
ncbi:MAG: class I SAM-dependent methyltransferase [Candidatus Acidiferrum sp.]|jgi:ubiquinone/menaquinone biosynthesis C-methylase UbiE